MVPTGGLPVDSLTAPESALDNPVAATLALKPAATATSPAGSVCAG